MADLIDRDKIKQTLLELGFYPAIVKYAYTFYGKHNFCNYCGARMDGESDY